MSALEAGVAVLVHSLRQEADATPPAHGLGGWLEHRPSYYYYGMPGKNYAAGKNTAGTKNYLSPTYASASGASARGLAVGTVPVHRASASQRRLVF